MSTPIITNPPDGALHPHTPTATFTWNMGAISHYSSRVLIGTLPGWSDVYTGREIVNNASSETDNTVTTAAGKQQYTKIQYRLTPGGIWRSGGTITSFTCT